MLDPTSILENIYSVTKLIYAQVQLVKANQEQCIPVVQPRQSFTPVDPRLE